MSIHPILFKTEMVLALLDGRKTVTRRVVKPQPEGRPVLMGPDSCWPGYFAIQGTAKVIQPPCQPGDILWVRETWVNLPVTPGGHFRPSGVYYYKAGTDDRPEQYKKNSWRPSIHMPREAARIFLRVTGVWVERLQDIDDAGVVAEGLEIGCYFDEIWDSTIKSKDRATYGWAVNPWVWVIQFEQINKKEAEHENNV